MFQMITQQCLKNPHVIGRLNACLIAAGISKQFTQNSGVGGTHFYEKLTFQGHEALNLLVRNDNRDLAIASILQSMWPSGDVVDDADGVEYVRRQTVLWEQWSKVVSLMTEKNPKNLQANDDGCSRFGKECREFASGTSQCSTRNTAGRFI